MRKKLKKKDLIRYNLDVWGSTISKGLFNRNFCRSLFSFEKLFRNYYFSNFLVLKQKLKEHFKERKKIRNLKFELKKLKKKQQIKRKKLKRLKKRREKKNLLYFGNRREDIVVANFKNENDIIPKNDKDSLAIKSITEKLNKKKIKKTINIFWSLFNYRYLQFYDNHNIDSNNFNKLNKKYILYNSIKGGDLISKKILSWKYMVGLRSCILLGKKLFLIKKLRFKEKVDYTLDNSLLFKKNKLPGWFLDMSEQKRFLYFYGFFSKKKFLSFINSHNISTKNSLTITLELILVNFIFKLGFFFSTIETYEEITGGRVLVNGRIIRNPYYKVKIFDNISFNPSCSLSLYLKELRRKLKRDSILLNIPPYVEYNLRIFYFSMWRLPKQSEILPYYQFPFYSS